MSQVETACPLDCPDSCSLVVTVQNGRVITLDGSERSSTTGGYICAKVRRFGEHVHGDARLLHPMRRTGPKGSGRFKRVAWDEALTLVASTMTEIRDRWGAEAVLPFSYGGSNGLLTQDAADATLFERFGASRLARTVCAAPTGWAAQSLYGKMPSVTYEDYPESRLIVLWGANPSDSGIHLVPYVREAQSRGARLVVVDPRATPLARQADLHLSVRPGTDVAVALSVHRHLFESGQADDAFLEAHTRGRDQLRERAAPWTFERAAETAGVDSRDLERFAQMYAEAEPALIRCGWGLERNRNGGNAALAVLALPAVGGKFGVRGGGYAMSSSSAWQLGRPGSPDPEPESTPGSRPRVVNMNHLGRALAELDEPPIRMLFVYNANPVATVPAQQRIVENLRREDLFTVVFDQTLTDTAVLADLVLPATTFLEHYDIARAYGPIRLHLVKPVIEPVGEARPNAEVFGEIARRLGLLSPDEPAEELETLLETFNRLPEALAPEMREHGTATPPCGVRPVQFVDVLPRTADGKVDLFPTHHDHRPDDLYRYRADPATDRYPLALISPASGRTISSTLGELSQPEVRLSMHPVDAEARQLATGDLVRVSNAQGTVECPVAVTTLIRPGTVSLPKGLWRRQTRNQWTSTTLVPDDLTDFGGGACFNDARVEVERMAPQADAPAGRP